ncbi:MAG: hemerythrin domain-containing protein, partial [Chloroflexota bacterium]
HEHHDRIMPHVDALPELAEMIGRVPLEDFAKRFEHECQFIVGQLMPHIDAIEQALYADLERLMLGRHSMQPMRDEHEQLRRLFSSLFRYRAGVAAGELDDASAIGLRRVLYRLFSLMKVHLAEEELYLQVIDRELSPAETDALARSIDHASAEPI